MRQYKFILSGGGTGGTFTRHIANELKLRFPDAEFLLWELRTRWKCKSTAGGLQDKGTVDCWFATKN
jgi:hypothetical protein